MCRNERRWRLALELAAMPERHRRLLWGYALARRRVWLMAVPGRGLVVLRGRAVGVSGGARSA